MARLRSNSTCLEQLRSLSQSNTIPPRSIGERFNRFFSRVFADSFSLLHHIKHNHPSELQAHKERAALMSKAQQLGHTRTLEHLYEKSRSPKKQRTGNQSQDMNSQIDIEASQTRIRSFRVDDDESERDEDAKSNQHSEAASVDVDAVRREFKLNDYMSMEQTPHFSIASQISQFSQDFLANPLHRANPSFVQNEHEREATEQATPSNRIARRQSSQLASITSDSVGSLCSTNWADFECHEIIGEGFHSIVKRAIWKGGTEVALKILKEGVQPFSRATRESSSLNSMEESGFNPTQSEFRREAHVLLTLRHPNIVLFLGAGTSPCFFLVTEYLKRGSLFSVLHDREKFNSETKVRMALEIANGMVYLHTRTPAILHRDLKTSNALVANDGTVKISDMGLALFKGKTKPIKDRLDVRIQAPEVLQQSQNYSEASDVWSFGMKFSSFRFVDFQFRSCFMGDLRAEDPVREFRREASF
jgi:hypothetical protein